MKIGKESKYPRSFWILLAGVFVNRFGSFVSIFLVFYLTARGFSPLEAGMAVSAYGIGFIGATYFGGYLADWLGRRNTIALSMFSSAITMLLLFLAPYLPLIIFLAGLAGITTELYRPATNALIADLVSAEHHVTAFAFYRMAINLGISAGPAIAGLLAKNYFLFLFLGDALTSIIFGLLVLLTLPAGRRSSVKEEQASGGFLRTLRSDRSFIFFLGASLAVAFIDYQYLSTFALQVRKFGFSTAIYGLLISLNGLLVVLFEVPISNVTKKLPVKAVIAVGVFLVGLGFGLTGLAYTIPLLVVTVIIWSLGEIIHSPVSFAYVSALAPAHMRGRYNGVWSMTWSAGQVLGPLLGTLVYVWNSSALWLLCGFLGLLSASLVISTR